MSEPILQLRGLRKSFGDTEIIRGVDLDVAGGERRALIGPNGAGKSTLFHLISGNLGATAGTVAFQGRDITGWAPQRVNRLGLARSFQITNIFPKLTVFENVRLAVMRQHPHPTAFWRRVDRLPAVREATERLLEQVRLHTRAGTICRSLLGNPRVILIDEPTEGLAPMIVAQVGECIRDMRTQGVSVVLVEQKLAIALKVSDRVCVMGHGRIVFEGTPAQLQSDPGLLAQWLAV
ncbi:MAG TPA: ABC transporter ATP-binding protein [Acidovorax sp.]|nr:ABC transporter ATP-binding protein [Acidovorax sp.]